MITSSTDGKWSGEPLTLEKLQTTLEILKDMPPPPFCGMSRTFPADRALVFTVDRVEYIGAHPDLWAKVPKASSDTNPLVRLRVIDLDRDGKALGEFMAALGAALKRKQTPAVNPLHPIRRANPVIRTDVT